MELYYSLLHRVGELATDLSTETGESEMLVDQLFIQCDGFDVSEDALSTFQS